MRKFIVIPLAILLPLFISYFYYRYNEVNDDWSIQCSFYQITGLQCPGCGGQRAFHYLLHGDFSQALRHNAILILTLPVLFFIYFSLVEAYGLKNMKYINSSIFGKNFGIITIIVILSFFLLRNIPCFPFIYLSPPV